MSNPAEYKKLKKVWYKKLLDSGFYDIESNNKQFKGGTSSYKVKSRNVAEEYQSRTEYYDMANDFLTRHKFKNKVHEAIWAYHVEGLSLTEIVDTLNKANVKNIITVGCGKGESRTWCKSTMYKVIQKYKELMKKGV